MFQKSFKYYKSRNPRPDLSKLTEVFKDNVEEYTSADLQTESIESFGLSPPAEWKIYQFKKRPGLIVIKNPFTAKGQRYWIKNCLEDYTKYPNPNNLLPHLFDEATRCYWWLEMKNAIPEVQIKLKNSLRWTTLGYHHDWNSKVYSEDKKNEFPVELRNMIAAIARVIGFHDFVSEAAIVNFYPLGSTLAAHTDHSEVDLISPLFSISFGQSAVFLAGGVTKDEIPEAILLESGDILVMAKESRLAYHAVPLIFKSDRKPWNESLLEDLQWKSFDEYLESCRINLNVRQVLPNKSFI